MSLTFDISELPAEVKRELVQGNHFQKVQDMEDAFTRQTRIARDAGEHRSMDGLGRVRMMIDETAYHYWGQRLGYECWRDPEFLREFERDNEEVRVRCGGTKLMIGWTPRGKRYQRKFNL